VSGDALANTIFLILGLAGLAAAALLSKRLRWVLIDLVRPGSIPDWAVAEEDREDEDERRVKVGVFTNDIASGGVAPGRESVRRHYAAGSTPAMGTPSG